LSLSNKAQLDKNDRFFASHLYHMLCHALQHAQYEGLPRKDFAGNGGHSPPTASRPDAPAPAPTFGMVQGSQFNGSRFAESGRKRPTFEPGTLNVEPCSTFYPPGRGGIQQL
jgi:hypothetical protein